MKKTCSPKIKSKKFCVQRPILLKIVDVINPHIDYPIEPHKNTSLLSKQVRFELQKLSNCRKEECWKDIPLLKNNMKKEDYEEMISSFRPPKPESWDENPRKWLTTTNIDKVMKQYEEAKKGFKYMGTLPIDFDLKKNDRCVVGDVCNFNLKDIVKENIKSLGFVFNIDPHNESGKHWFSLYVDLIGINLKNQPAIYYFDSVVGSLPYDIEKLIKKIKKEYKQIHKKSLKVYFNNLQHQYGMTECGVYCIHFLNEMLMGKDFQEYISNRISDDEMFQYRNIYFS